MPEKSKKSDRSTRRYPAKNTLRKKQPATAFPETVLVDSLSHWIDQYLSLAIDGIRPENAKPKIRLHLDRFRRFMLDRYGHARLSACLKRDVLAWQTSLIDRSLAPSTVNNHLATLSAFTTWLVSHDRPLLPSGDPAKGVSELPLPPLEPRALTEPQIRSLKNLLDRLERFHTVKGRSWASYTETPPLKAKSRPLRDRAIVCLLLSTGLRREELVSLRLDQIQPCDPQLLRQARKAKVIRVKGKGKTERTVFLSLDARLALADYIEKERSHDHGSEAIALFLSPRQVSARRPDGSLTPQAINAILAQIGRWHDAETKDTDRHISPLRPHDLRHTFAFLLAQSTGSDAYELERRLGHRSQRYIQRYTNPPETIAASYIEDF